MNERYDLPGRSGAAEEPEFTAFDRLAYRIKKQAERKELFSLIDTTTEKMMGSGELFQTYLDVQARLDRYSVSNAILVAAQLPEAAGPLKSFDEWKEEGVHVREGETAVSVLVPGQEFRRENGSTGINFNVKKVFDITQTDREPRPSPRESMDAGRLLNALLSRAPCMITSGDELPENADAVYSPGDQIIYVRTGLEGPDLFRAYARELAHARMDPGDGYVREENETAADCAAYLLCKRYGIPTDPYRFDAVPERYGTMEPKEFRAELKQIRSTAGEISREMDRALTVRDRGDAR